MNSLKQTQGAKRRPKKNTKQTNVALRTAKYNPDQSCALHYGAALFDPFNTDAGACVPKFPAINSAKRKVFARGTGLCVGNNGGVVCGTGAANNGAAVLYTTAGWVASGPTSLPGGGDAGIQTASPNCSFDVAAFGASATAVQCRTVACGIRVRYIGTPLEAGGLAYELEQPDHTSIEGYSVAQMNAFADSSRTLLNGQWIECLYQPRFPADFGYFPDPNGQSAGTVRFLGIQLTPATAGAAFEWEYFAHYEFIGSSVQGKSPSHVSPLTDRILSAVAQAPPGIRQRMANDPESGRKLSTLAVKQGASMWSQLGRGLLGGAARVGSIALGGFLGGPAGAAAGNAIGYGGQMAIAA